MKPTDIPAFIFGDLEWEGPEVGHGRVKKRRSITPFDISWGRRVFKRPFVKSGI